MTDRSTGLIGFTPKAKSQQREQRDVFIENWERDNPDFVNELRSQTKDVLVRLLVEHMIGDAYDSAMVMATAAVEPEVVLDEIDRLTTALLYGSPAEARAAVESWRDAEIARAGKNIKRIRTVAGAASNTLLRIELKPRLDALNRQRQALEVARPLAATAKREAAEGKKRQLNAEIEKLLNSYSRWTAKEIVETLVHNKKMFGYTRSSLEKRVAQNMAELRKAEKATRTDCS